MRTNAEYLTAYRDIPYAILNREVTSTRRMEVEEELREIYKLYLIYNNGADFETEGSNGDYIPATLKYKEAKSITSKEARFMFSNPPDIRMSPLDLSNKQDKEAVSVWNNLVSKILTKNGFELALLKACKDCFIGKRVLAMLNFNDTGIQVNFVPSLEFYYETDPINAKVLTKVVTFQRIVNSKSLADTRIFFKKYYMENGVCMVEEILFNGSGVEIEVITPPTKTLFSYIPATVILNDGLTGNTQGESELSSLGDYEAWYSRLSNADMDAERKSMNPTKWTMDCSPDSTQNLSTAAGAYWDLISDPNSEQSHQGTVGLIEPTMAYKDALSNTLTRIKDTMYQEVDVPNTASEALQGVVTSGKTLKAIYWGLSVRCDEKMLAWIPAIQFIVDCIYDGVRLYPNSAKAYTNEPLLEVDYEVIVESNYALPEDEQEEKAIDMAEVSSQVMSRKSYLTKWRGMTDEEADEEIRQILLEKQLFDDGYIDPQLNPQNENLNRNLQEEHQQTSTEGTGEGDLDGETEI